MTTSRRQPRRLSTFDPIQWLGGREPTTREGVLAAYAAWRRARRDHWRERAPYGTPPPSAWEEARAFSEALARLRGQATACEAPQHDTSNDTREEAGPRHGPATRARQS